MLAVGGAGVTYVARELDGNDEEVGPRIAIKVLLAARDQGPYVRRLATEAQIIQELDHPNIVEYLGFVHRTGHSPYLLTRFESGGSLLDHMRRVGTLSVKQAALVGRQICWALEKAHERDIVHRDLKPENVLLTSVVAEDEHPVVRVADFGIAKVQGSLGSNLTRVGAFVGTPHYAAPEQFVGGAVTEAADVYALGALMYFTMTAKHVVRFADRLDPEDGFQLLCDALPPVLERASDDPEAIRRMQAVLAAAMEIDPLARCSVVELDALLQSVVANEEPALPERTGDAPPSPPSGASVLGMAAVAAEASPEATVWAGKGDSTDERAEASPDVAAPAPPSLPELSSAGALPTVEQNASRKRSWGAIIAGLAAVVLIGGGLAAGGGLALLMWAKPELVETARELVSGKKARGASRLPDAPLLVPDSKASERDLHVVRKSLEKQKRGIKKACAVGGGAQVEVTFVVDGSGEVLGARGKGAQGSCVADALVGRTLERNADRTVRVSYAFVW